MKFRQWGALIATAGDAQEAKLREELLVAEGVGIMLLEDDLAVERPDALMDADPVRVGEKEGRAGEVVVLDIDEEERSLIRCGLVSGADVGCLAHLKSRILSLRGGKHSFRVVDHLDDLLLDLFCDLNQCCIPR